MSQPRPPVAVDHRIALADEVAPPKGDRVEAELPGELIDERFDSERRLRSAGTAVRAGSESIRPHAVRADVERRPAIWARDEDGRDLLDRPLDVRARVEHESRVDRHERAVRAGPDPELDHGGCGRVRPRDVLPACEREADRSSENQRGARDERIDDEDLRSECSAEWRTLDADTGQRKPVDLRELPPCVEGSLGAALDGETAIRIDPRRCRVRLDVPLVDPVRAETPGDGGISCRESGKRVAPGISLAVDDVRREVLDLELRAGPADGGMGRLGVNALVAGGLVDELGQPCLRAVRAHRRLDVDDRRQPLHVDDDEGECVFGRRLRLGHDEGHRLAGEQDLVTREGLEHPHVLATDDR